MTTVNGLSQDNYAPQFWCELCVAEMARYAHHSQITSQAPAVTRLLTCMNAGSLGRKPTSEHDWEQSKRYSDAPKVMTTTEVSARELFSSAMQRLRPSIIVQRCYLIPSGLPASLRGARQGKERQRGALA